MNSLNSGGIKPYDAEIKASDPKEETVGQKIWNIDDIDLKTDILQELFERMDLGRLLAFCQVDKFSKRIAIQALSAKASKGFPDLASVARPIPLSTITVRIERIHKIAENCGCKLDLLEQEKANSTIKGTKLLEEYLDYRSTLIIWQKLADCIGVSTELDLSNLNSVADFRDEASKFGGWFDTHINQLINLLWVNLTENNLTSLPPEIGRLDNLQTLGLNGNYLTSLPSEIGQLPNLITLDLSNNKLTSLPSEIRKLINLQNLSLSNNKLTSLSPEFPWLINLKDLKLSGNPLSFMHSLILSYAPISIWPYLL